MNISEVEEYIVVNGLLGEGEKVIVGVSGGADSVALLDILYSLKVNCVVAHCNFHLRGDESNRDAVFVEGLSKKYNLKYEHVDFDTEVYAKKKSISIEMAARELRYNWFEEIRIIYMAQKVAVAHHCDDSVETVLLNLIRGTGIRGLTGISPINENIIRPLLNFSHNDILEYLADRKLNYVEDSTNKEELYTRNKIRLSVIPLLETINPAAKDAISRTAEHLSQVANIYQLYIEQAKRDVFKDDKIDIMQLAKYAEPEAVLYELLSPYGFNSDTIWQVILSLAGQSGKMFYSKTHELLKDRGYLILKEKHTLTVESFNIHEGDEKLFYPIHLEIEIFAKNSDFSIEKDMNVLYLDAHKLSYPLVVRKWQQGDWFVPFGMKGKKKISDYFTNNKFSLFDKEATWLLCSGEDIVWIVGQRSDDRFKITPKTTKVLKILYDCNTEY